MSAITFEILATDNAARCGRLTTPHGTFETPVFMPVGTQATVKGLTPDMVAAAGAKIILGQHLSPALRPGDERSRQLGGLHKFMNWDGAILTDSGGFQVFSLADIRKITDQSRDVSHSHRWPVVGTDTGTRRSRFRRTSAPTLPCVWMNVPTTNANAGR